jgi:hypothetical protein
MASLQPFENTRYKGRKTTADFFLFRTSAAVIRYAIGGREAMI